jgi:hypothetical protein
MPNAMQFAAFPPEEAYNMKVPNTCNLFLPIGVPMFPRDGRGSQS